MVDRRVLLVAGLTMALVMLVVGAIVQPWSLGEDIPPVEVAALQLTPTTDVVETTTTTTTTAEAPPEPLRTATLAFTGDTLAHRGVVRQARTYATEADLDAEYDFAPMFALVEPYLAAADVAICHLETPLSPDNERLSGYPTFNVPHELAAGLVAAGYDGCTVASNHALDRGSRGVADTLDVLDAAGLAHSGTARTAEEDAAPTLYEAGGITVANLSYTYGLNGFTMPADSPWLVNLIDSEQILADAVAARDAGAEYVVVSIHWGTEYRTEPNDQQVEVAKAVAASGLVDAIVGHHAHVVQPVEVIDGTPVIYGLGNFLSNQSANCCVAAAQDGVITQIHVQETRESRDAGGPPDFVTWLTHVPTWVDRSDFTIVPVADSLSGDDLDENERRLLTKSKDRTESAVEGRGHRLTLAPAPAGSAP